MNFYATNRNGKLEVVSEWTRVSYEPKDVRHFYPTGLDAECFADILGKPLHYDGCGVYSCGRYEFPLIDNEKTWPSESEYRDVKKPKWAKGYKDGEWKRYEVEEVA